MKGYTKLTVALAAFVLLFIAIGMNSQSTVLASGAGDVTLTVVPTTVTTLTTDGKLNNTICSTTAPPSTCAANDGTFTITVHDFAAAGDGTIQVSVKNTDLATVNAVTDPASEMGDGVDDNPKDITLVEVGGATGNFERLVASKKASTGLVGDLTVVTTGNPTTAVEVKAFTGNTLQATYSPTGALGVTKSITVDNVKPTLLTTSPASGLITKGNTTVVFSADITDSGAGFPTKSSNVVANNGLTQKGRIQLFVGTSAVTLSSSAYTAIEGGWRVSGSFSSNDIANIGAKVPWWIEAEDLAGNVQQPSGSTSSTATADGAIPDDGVTASTVVDSAFAGLPDDLFKDRKMRITIDGVDQTETIVAFTGASGTFIFGTAAADSFTETITSGTTYKIINTLLITVDSSAPKVGSTADVQTGHAWGATFSAGSRLRVGTNAKNTSIRVTFTDASGLDGSTVSPVSFAVTGNTVNSTLLVDVTGENAAAPEQRIPNDVFLTLANALSSSERPTVSVSSGLIKDKAGNAVTGGSFKATDKLGPGLTLSTSSGLSKKEIKVTIAADEQLNANPVAVLKTLSSGTSGTLSRATVFAFVDDKNNDTGVATPDTLDDEFGMTAAQAAFITTPTVNADVDVNGVDDNTGLTNAAHTALLLADALRPGTIPTPSQTTALSYSYTTKIASIPAAVPGAEFNVYVTGNDTSVNPGKAGHISDGTNSSALTFELDKMLNGGKNPKVSVSDQVATVTTATAANGPKVEAVDPMIVTVDFNRRCNTDACTGTGSDAKGESAEYPRDSFKTVTLTSASLKVTFSDGSSETTTFDLATQVSSPDSKRFTIPVLSPKVGKYQLTIKAVDEAGNNTLTTPTAVTAQSLKFSWEVTAAKPVKLALAPGWNLISLPFQPANPAINSVISSTHPADIVMTFDNANQVWLVSRRDADTGLFTGDVRVMTANTAYFVRTDNFQELSILRPPIATAAAAPPPPPAIAVVPGWNLVPVVSLTIPLPKGIDADAYFGTLQSGANKGWLKAMTFSPLTRTWTSVTPSTVEFTAAGTETVTDSCGASTTFTGAGQTVKTQVCVGKGYWLYASAGGVIIP